MRELQEDVKKRCQERKRRERMKVEPPTSSISQHFIVILWEMLAVASEVRVEWG